MKTNLCPNCSVAMKHLVPGLYICENCIPDDSPEGLNERFGCFDIMDALGYNTIIDTNNELFDKDRV